MKRSLPEEVLVDLDSTGVAVAVNALPTAESPDHAFVLEVGLSPQFLAMEGTRIQDENRRAMAEAGVAGPAVALRDGLLTVMVRSAEHEKVISADIAFSFTEDRQLRVKLLGMQAGRLALPDWWVHDRLDALRGSLRSDRGQTDPETNGESQGRISRDVGALLRRLLAAIDREPISAELTWRISTRHLRIDEIEIADGRLRVRVVPVAGKERRASRR